MRNPIRRLSVLLMCSLISLSAWSVSKKVKQEAQDIPDKQVLAEAQKAWNHRDQPMQSELATVLWERALQIHPDHHELYIALSKSCGRLYRHAKETAEKKFWADEARRYGEQAVEKNPNSPPAYAAYGEALGQWAQANKGVGSLKVVKQAVAELEKSIALDPHYAFAHMLLSQFYEKSPSWLSVGDKKKALEHAKLAVEYGGNYAINRVSLAKMYLDRGDKAVAKEQLQKAVALTAPADAIPETKSDQDEARELLKGL